MSRLCRLKNKSHGDDGQWAYGEIVSLRKQRDELLAALENCRLLAARHRKEEWAGHVLRFCGESGVAGEVMR